MINVMKFGAAATSDVQRLRDLVRVVREATGREEQIVVVCTAPARVTDALIRAARAAAKGEGLAADEARRELWTRHRALAERLVSDDWEREVLYKEWAEMLKKFDRITRAIGVLGEHSARSIDTVAALGEQFITNLVAVALREAKVPAKIIPAPEIFLTDDHFGNARPLMDETVARAKAKLGPLLAARIVPVVAGYTGATSDGAMTTLGRGGGDYSATIIGAAIGADVVTFWTDTDGILTADPKIVPEARTLPELSFIEAAEVATLGAEVLHQRTLAPLAAAGIPLRLRNVTNTENPGTLVLTTPSPSERSARAIISARGLSLLSATASARSSIDQSWTPEFTTAALERLTDSGIEILTFSQSFSERSLTLTVRASDATFARDELAAILAASGATAGHTITMVTPVAMIAVIAAHNTDSLTPLTFAAIGRAGAHVFTLACDPNALHIAFTLPEAELDDVVRALHRDLRLA